MVYDRVAYFGGKQMKYVAFEYFTNTFSVVLFFPNFKCFEMPKHNYEVNHAFIVWSGYSRENK